MHPFRFFGWVLLLSVPFFVWGVFWPVRGLPFDLPATVVMIVVPAVVATMLTRREAGGAAVWALWRRTGDVRQIAGLWWLLVALLCTPTVSLPAYFIMPLFDLPLPAIISVPLSLTPLLFVIYIFGAIFEEVGWTAYATEPLQSRYGILGAGLVIGAVWALWNLVPWWLGQGHVLSWVIGQNAHDSAHARGYGMEVCVRRTEPLSGDHLPRDDHDVLQPPTACFRTRAHTTTLLAGLLTIILGVIAWLSPITSKTADQCAATSIG